ncbi:hypothetical protein OROMI_002569 [Orobanche minor]
MQLFHTVQYNPGKITLNNYNRNYGYYRKGLKVLALDEEGNSTDTITNIVYKEFEEKARHRKSTVTAKGLKDTSSGGPSLLIVRLCSNH